MSYQTCDITDLDVPLTEEQSQLSNPRKYLMSKSSIMIAVVVSIFLSVVCYTRYVDPAVIDYALHPTAFITKDAVCTPQGKNLVIFF